MQSVNAKPSILTGLKLHARMKLGWLRCGPLNFYGVRACFICWGIAACCDAGVYLCSLFKLYVVALLCASWKGHQQVARLHADLQCEPVWTVLGAREEAQ